MSKAYFLNEGPDNFDTSGLKKRFSRKFTIMNGLDFNVENIDVRVDIAVAIYPFSHDESECVSKSTKLCNKIGLKVIAIYVEDVGDVPSEIAIGGFSAVCLDSNELEKVVEGKVVWEKPGGEKPDYNNIRRNKC